MMYLAIALGALFLIAMIGLTFSMAVSASRYDDESDEIAKSDDELAAACEGAMIRELADHGFLRAGQ